VITPTVGRVVWIRGRVDSIDLAQPETAQIVYVHNDMYVNVAGFDGNGEPFRATSVYLVQDGTVMPSSVKMWAEWMPYQKGQAAKTEALEAATKETSDFNELKRMARAGEPLIDIHKDRSKDAGRVPK
jgi:hypothetical protein